MDETPASKPARPSSSRRRRRLKWLMYLVFLALTILICHFGWTAANREWTRRQGERELAETQAAVERSDPDWSWERLNAKRVRPPAGQNSADLIPQIKRLSDAEWGKELAKEEWKPRLEVPPNVRYSPAVIAQVRRDLAASAQAVKLARTLKDHPRGSREIVLDPDVWNTRLEDTANTRVGADLLRWDVVIAVEEGDHPRAAGDLLALLNLSRSLGDEPFLISQLIRMAVRAIAMQSAQWLLAQSTDPPPLADFQAALAEDADEPLLLYGLRGERAVGDRMFENLDNGTATPRRSLEWNMDSPWSRFAWWNYRGYIPADRALFLSWMTQAVEYARLPIHGQAAAFSTLVVPDKNPRHTLTNLFLPAAERVANAHWRTTAEARCAVVGIACERFRQQKGRWPNELAELVPAFLPAVPLDPYDGLPLKLAKLDDGIVIHSVGKYDPAASVKTWGRRPELPEGIDFGFRLWNPDQRRLPPPPGAAPASRQLEQP
jgi:hypothetical protein